MKTKKLCLKHIIAFLSIVLFYFKPIWAQTQATETITIDGIINELFWSKSEVFNSFVQFEPDIFKPSAVKTEIYFNYDKENIYIAGKLYQNKATISANKGRKDDSKILNGDCIYLALDPLKNGNSAYFIAINPANAQVDGTLDATGNMDFKWDAIFVSQTQVYDSLWTFELKLPLTSISFQNADKQTWGLMFSRTYAFKQEKSINQLIDKNIPFRVSDFYKKTDIYNIKKAKKIQFTPYLYGFADYNKLKDSVFYQGKIGGEIKYTPTPSSEVIATINPDFAQVETDQQIINVTDLPTIYPEKRPFFTESSDLYSEIEVNTRNINSIDYGLKYRHTNELTKFDLTTVLDNENTFWGLTDFRISDNKKYQFEVVSGLKSLNSDYFKDYNYDASVKGILFFFNKQLSISTKYQIMNSPISIKNEWGNGNRIEWYNRNWELGLVTKLYSEFYNPEIIGFPVLSNETILCGYMGYTFYNENGMFRKTTILNILDRYDLYSNPGNAYFVDMNSLESTVNLGDLLGNWVTTINYYPNIRQQFRFRNQNAFGDNTVYHDAISNFVLIDHWAKIFEFSLNTDTSKKFGVSLNYNNNLIRKSKSNNYSGEAFLKLGSKSQINYSINYIDIEGSDYQSTYRQTIHGIKADYNIMDKMNLRLIIQPNQIHIYDTEYFANDFNFNLTYSWEFMPGGNLYLVYTHYRNDESLSDVKSVLNNNHALILKISKTF